MRTRRQVTQGESIPPRATTSGGRQYPVFYDPSGIRGRIVKAVLILIGSYFLVQVCLLAWGLLVPPALPQLRPPEAPRSLQASEPAVSPVQPAGCQLLEAVGTSPPQPSDRGPQTNHRAGGPLAFAFMVPGDPQGLISLGRHMSQIDVLIPQWLHYSPANGMLIEDDPRGREAIVDLIAEGGAGVRIMPLVSNMADGDWNTTDFCSLLANRQRRRYMADQLVEYAQGHRFLGISVDFEKLPESSLPDYYTFVEELAGQLHAQKLQLSVNVPFEGEVCDYGRLARAADHVIVMAYDEHWRTGEAGPIAGIDWLRRVGPKLQGLIPPGKLVLALGNYAYDWSPRGPAAVKTVEEALATARQAAAQVASDEVSLNPSFRYRDADGQLHQVWLLDAVTAFDAMVTFASARPGGMALWRLGMEDPSIWEFFGKGAPSGGEVARRLCRLDPQSVLYQGKGEVIHLASRPAPGLRRLWFDAVSGLIRGEQYAALPSPYVVSCYPQNPRQIALTFDDGPDPTFTPAVLSVLREADVKATFFVVGANCQWYGDMLRQEVSEGHEIGNHTFTHPDISRITPRQLMLELSACQQSLAVVAGCRTVLFRPPYGRDLNPTSLEHLKPLEEVTDLGYVTVGMRIDAEDWANPGVDEIVSNVLEQAEAGGQIVVMHDAGGDRRQTVQALPRIISELRHRGYELVTVSRLLGLTRQQVMPPLSPGEQTLAWSNRAAFWELRAGIRLVQWIFITGLALGLLRMVLIACGAIWHRRHARHPEELPAPDLSVSVIVPAHNEEDLVVATVRSLLASVGVAPFDILVVDDGSTDDTCRRAADAFADEPRVQVFSKPNGGKSSALNFGLARAKGDIVIMLDADTIFEPQTIRRLLTHFSDPTVGAVAGNVKVGNRINVLTRMQALEYITSQSLDRRALTSVNSNMVVPGAVGAWRREVVLRAGMFNHRTLAEDADLTVTVCRMGFQIEYEPNAIAYTEAPDNHRAFLRQRSRWMFGTFQVAAKHLSALFDRRCPYLGFIGMPNILLFQVFYPLIAPLMDLMILCSVILLGYAHWHDAPNVGAAARQFALYYLLFLGMDTLSALLAFRLEDREDWKLLLWVPIQRLFYRFALYYVAIKSVFASLTGKAVGWGTIQRKATVVSRQ